MKKTRKVRKSSSNRKIQIEIDWDTNDNGFSSLYNNKVLDFVLKNIKDGYNLIQTQDNKPFLCNGKSIMYLQAIKVKSWPQEDIEWNKMKDNNKEFIECKSFNDWIKTSPCNIGNKSKMFARLKSNPFIGGFATYLICIFSGYITINKHKEFVKAMKKTFKNKPIIIHNQDVDWFHMKEYITK